MNVAAGGAPRIGPQAAPCCVVCGAVMARAFSAHAGGAYPSCDAVACRMVMSRRADMGEPGFRHYLQTQARQRQFQAAATHAAAERKLAEARENAAAWQALRARLPAGLTPEPLALLLPSGPRRASPLAALRRKRYRTHLLQIIDEAAAFVGPVAPVTTAAGASAMPGGLCALCGGGCCTKGGNEAYLSAATMRRFMQAQPDLSKEQVAAAYLACVSGKTQAGSCINHTGQGCSLPKEMRSDICNRFSCDALDSLQAAQRGRVGVEAVQAVLVVRRKQDHWNRAQPGLENAVTGLALLRETGATRVAPGLYTTAAAIASKVS